MKTSNIALLALLAAGCQAKLDRAQALALVTGPDKGTVAGYSLGDKWTDVTARHDPALSVADGKGLHQLRLDLGAPGSIAGGVVLTFRVDDGGLVTRIEALVHGMKGNAITVRQLDDDILDYYDKKYGKGACSSGACTYKLPGDQQLGVRYSASSGSPIYGTVTISLPAE